MSMDPSPHRTRLAVALAALTVAACAVDDLPSAPSARSSAAAVTPSPYHVTSLADDGG